MWSIETESDAGVTPPADERVTHGSLTVAAQARSRPDDSVIDTDWAPGAADPAVPANASDGGDVSSSRAAMTSSLSMRAAALTPAGPMKYSARNAVPLPCSIS